MASEDSNKETVRRIFEQALNDGDAAVINELIADGYVNHDMPAPAPGPEGFRQVVGQFRAAFPDMRIIIDDLLGEGDAVCTRGHFEGTHEGEFMGIPGTGRKVDVKYIDAWRLEGGKAVENWVQLDMLGLMQQLGAIPSAG
jgi:predicted ester cyclase